MKPILSIIAAFGFAAVLTGGVVTFQGAEGAAGTDQAVALARASTADSAADLESDRHARAAAELLDRADAVRPQDADAAASLLDEAAEEIASVASADRRDLLRARSLLIAALIANSSGHLSDHADGLAQAAQLLDRVAPNSLEMGEVQRLRAILFFQGGDYGRALQAATLAHDLLRDHGASRSQALTLQIIGSLYGAAGDQERALRYFQEARDIYSEDPVFGLAVENNVALTLKELGRYEEAVDTFAAALATAERADQPVYAARILSNMAQVYIQLGEWAEARNAIRRAKADIIRLGDATYLPFVEGLEAELAFRTGNPGRAATLFDAAFAGQDLATTDDSFHDFHEVAYRAYAETGQQGLALRHLLALKRLDDERAALTANVSNAVVGARFDFANQELKIATLRAGQLERDVQLAEQRAGFNRRIVIFVVLAAMVIVGLTLLALFNIRRRRDEVNAANIELAHSNENLAKALDAKSAFLATTSHEIRTPLNGILGMTQVMLADGQLAPEFRERVELVHGAGTSMKAIVDDILDVAKLDSGTITLKSDLFPLARTLRGVAQVFADQAQAKGVDFDCRLDRCPEWAIGDEQRVRQIVYNLVSNAVKFTSEGQVVLSAQADGDNPDDVILFVSDTGIGIPIDQQEAIFSPFHQVDGSRTRHFSGTGLGLTISREFTVTMGGTLDVDSRPGDGSSFRLRIPLQLREAEALAERQRADGLAMPDGRADLVVYASNGLLVALATRALQQVDRAAVFTESLGQAIAKVRAGNAKTLLLVFGAGPVPDEAGPLAALKTENSDLSILAAGWPENWGEGAVPLDRHAENATALLSLLSPEKNRAGSDPEHAAA